MKKYWLEITDRRNFNKFKQGVNSIQDTAEEIAKILMSEIIIVLVVVVFCLYSAVFYEQLTIKCIISLEIACQLYIYYIYIQTPSLHCLVHMFLLTLTDMYTFPLAANTVLALGLDGLCHLVGVLF